MTDKTLPKSIRTKALKAIAAIHAWNAAVYQARAQEALDDCIGRLEYRLMTGKDQWELGMASGHAPHTLDALEQTYRAKGWSPQQFYTQVGTERPAVVKEGPKVVTWREGQR